MSIQQAFSLAAQRCARSGAWCQGASARDQFGKDVRDSHNVAVSRWMGGHFADVATLDEYNAGFKRLADICDGAPTAWNDKPGRTQIEVVAKLREAAALFQPE
jgi:hypothetical protein